MKTNQIVLDTIARKSIIQNLVEKLQSLYIFPDLAKEICARLQIHLDDGAYDDMTEGDFFAYALTTHMQEVNQDEHLWVKWHSEPLPDEQETLRHDPKWRAEQQLKAKLFNNGFHKVERLPGNIGYLDIRYFHRPAWGGETAVAAMNFLAHTTALIIDLRKCPGGFAGMISLISSYLLGEDSVHLGTVKWTDDG
ncbi:MAG: peptidase, partial [Chloroflexi bacterium]|nr:peptidase [Chloroflexota bacterium]